MNFSLAGTSVWRYMGLNFVLFLGAIQSIPDELYEAAELDGATQWQQFWAHHLARHPPHHRPVVHPGDRRQPRGLRDPVHHDRRRQRLRDLRHPDPADGVQFRQVGLASAMAVVLLAIVLIVTWIQRKVFPDEKVDLT